MTEPIRAFRQPELAGKVALVTGAASGIGQATAAAFAREGAIVYLADMNAAGAVRGAGDIGGHAASLDVADSHAVDALFARIAKERGGVDVLANIAGMAFAGEEDRAIMLESAASLVAARAEGRPAAPAPIRALESFKDQTFRRMLDVHVMGAFFCIRAAIPQMRARGGGAIVNCSSESALTGRPGVAHYSAAKAALLGLTRSAAAELGPFGIRVNAVLPGAIDTPAVHDGEAFQLMQMAAGQAPLMRLGMAEEVAETFLFLGSPRSAYITGQCVRVNGGVGM